MLKAVPGTEQPLMTLAFIIITRLDSDRAFLHSGMVLRVYVHALSLSSQPYEIDLIFIPTSKEKKLRHREALLYPGTEDQASLSVEDKRNVRPWRKQRP